MILKECEWKSLGTDWPWVSVSWLCMPAPFYSSLIRSLVSLRDSIPPPSSRFLKIHSSVAQLLCRGWSVTCFIREYVRSCNVVSYAAHTQQWGLICLCWPVGGSSAGEEQLWRHLQPDNVSPGFLLLFSASEDYFLQLLSYLFSSFFLSFLEQSYFFVPFSLRNYQLYSFLEVGRIHDLVKYGLRTGNRRGMNG